MLSISMGESNTVLSAYTLYRHLNSIALTHQFDVAIIFEGKSNEILLAANVCSSL